MAHFKMVDAFIRQELEAACGDGLTYTDDTYIVPSTPPTHVQVLGIDGPALRVVASTKVLEGIEQSPELLGVLNEINRSLPYGRAVHHERAVWVEHSVLGRTIDWPQLDNAIRLVTWAAERYGPELAQEFATPAHFPAADRPEQGSVAEDALSDLGREHETLAQEPALDLQAADRSARHVNAAGYL